VPAPGLLAKLGWYRDRLAKMSPAEVAWRASDQVRKWTWARDQVEPGHPGLSAGAPEPLHRGRAWPRPLGQRQFAATLPPGALEAVPVESRPGLFRAADEVMGGNWEVLGVLRTDLEHPDWFFDPVTARRAPQSTYCFRVDQRDETLTGNVKQIWELSRMHHVSLLAAAYALSGDDRYAERAAAHLRSWWAENPFLSGVHWTSGIEAGVRLISWVWARRLLDSWDGARALFEDNHLALAQIWWHQRYLAAFRSRGSSANNHVIAEAAGQLVAALAFDWFPESDRWADEAHQLLEVELANNTFPSGVNREMAFEYHGLVAELGLIAGAEADRAGQPLGEHTWELLGRMLDVVAATVDVRLQAPRYGDGDDGRGLVLDDPDGNRWESLLSLGRELLGTLQWWPSSRPDVSSTLLGALAARHPVDRRPRRRPGHFADAGLTILHTAPAEEPEIWCRCDSGPHGFLSIGAHGHADALSLEIRHRGTEILADPGTYCYHGEPRWRAYFRSTIGHNTLELDGQDQSDPSGPFMWARQASTHLVVLDAVSDAETMFWSAEHDGYTALDPPAVHRRTVRLRPRQQTVEVADEISSAGPHRFRLAWHLGPSIQAVMDGREVRLSWTTEGSTATAALHLPAIGSWRLARGEEDPPLGWYSPRFGVKQPSITVLGEGTIIEGVRLETVLDFGSS
jgi:hypothetical protein